MIDVALAVMCWIGAIAVLVKLEKKIAYELGIEDEF